LEVELILSYTFLLFIYFSKGYLGWGAHPGSFDFVYFLIPSRYRWATVAPHPFLYFILIIFNGSWKCKFKPQTLILQFFAE
jgi:hypothetical protein